MLHTYHYQFAHEGKPVGGKYRYLIRLSALNHFQARNGHLEDMLELILKVLSILEKKELCYEGQAMFQCVVDRKWL
jgi:hypothetical protein